MVFKSNRQRKGFFANKGSTRAGIAPTLLQLEAKVIKNRRKRR